MATGAPRPPRRGARVLPRRFYRGDALEVAPLLLNKLLVRGARAGRIVEVEAYRGSDDAGSHAYRGPTKRNATMFGPPGRLYVYFTYGMHWCANAVCMPDGTAHAVLLRALAPEAGLEEMRAHRPAVRVDHHLASGPAKLCQAMGITGSDDGADLVSGVGGLQIVDDGVPPPDHPGVSPRVGLRHAAELPWRWWVPGDPNVSRGRAGVPTAKRRARASSSGAFATGASSSGASSARASAIGPLRPE